MIASAKQFKLEEIEVVDPGELATAAAREAKFKRNLHWFEEHAKEIGARSGGHCICIAGEELFVATTAEQALALARAAHPDDDGFFLHYVHKEKAARIYAFAGVLADMRGRRVDAHSDGRDSNGLR